MSKIEQQSIADQLYHQIKRKILSGELKGGDPVLEEKIAQDFGVSRTPVREAIKRLESYGLIRMRPRSHAEVIQFEGQDEAHKLALVRLRIEALVAELLAGTASEADCQALDELVIACEDSLATRDVAEIFERDSALHLEMARRTGNQYLYEILERLDAKIQLYRISTCVTLDKISEDVKQHRQILTAICQRDSALAVALMETHILGLSVEKV
ncbi:MAG: GntR family transcriptional regulator [Anaerolineae bacterium]|nr:GntR family transcriptional regulator [Anaerolineae bacterium]